VIRNSLRTRLLAGAAVALVAFLGLAALALDRAFAESVRAGIAGELRSHVYGLLAAAEPAPGGGVRMPDRLPEERLERAASGLYAWITDGSGHPAWQSASLLGDAPATAPLAPGQGEFAPARVANVPVFLFRFGFAFEQPGGADASYTASVAVDQSGYTARRRAFRHTMGAWLGGAAVLLVGVLVAGLHWSLRPLRAVAGEISQIERGERERLAGEYPVELRALTDNLNALLDQRARQQARYRDSLGDLAHSLKTPLAVLRASLDETGPGRPGLLEQVDRMHQIVEHQLRRASAAGRPALSAPVPVAESVARIVRAVQKVHAARGLTFEIAVTPGSLFHGDPGDLTEVLGNLLDNAGKWARGQVIVYAEPVAAHGAQRSGLRLTVIDDGPGFAPGMAEEHIARGVRADHAVPGQGIGLAVVRDIVQLYGGLVRLEAGTAGGAAVVVEFPPA